VSLTVTAVNDAPVAQADTGSATEAGGLANASAGTPASGNVLTNDSDVDTGDAKTVSAVSGGTLGAALTGSYGTLTLNADGSYSYVVNETNTAVQALRTSAQTLTESFTYTVQDDALTPATASAVLTVTIRGANDAALISSDARVLVVSQEAQSASGVLTLSDVDGPAAFVAQPGTRGLYGTFTLAADGSWTYTTDGAHKELETGAAYGETFSVTTADGTSRPDAVTITITRAASAAVPAVPPAADLPPAPPAAPPAAATTMTAATGTTSAPPPADTGIVPVVSIPRADAGAEPGRDTRLVDPVLQRQPVNVAGNLGAAASDAPGGITAAEALANLSALVNSLPATAAGGVVPDAGRLSSAGTDPLEGQGSAALQSNDLGFPVARLPAAAASNMQFANDAASTGQHRLFVYEGVGNAHGDALYQLPRDAFAHTDPAAVVKLEARKVNGEPLPSWVQFDPVAGVFSGTAPGGAPIVMDVLLTARDVEGREASVVFKLNLGDAASAPAAAPGAGRPGSVPAGDPTGKPVTGAPGTGAADAAAGDPLSAASFTIALAPAGRAGDAAPGFAGSQLDSTERGFPVTRVAAGAAMQFTGAVDTEARLFVYQGILQARGGAEYRVPRDAFGHTDPGAIVRLEARLWNGDPLPAWLSFDPVSGTFRGTPPAGADAVLELLLIAKDREGREASIDFQLQMGVPEGELGAEAEVDESFILGDGKLPKGEQPVEPSGESGKVAADKESGKVATEKPSQKPVKQAAASFGEQIKASKATRDPLLAKILETKAKPRNARA
jgi:VCBS repeat-containing protein